MSGRKIQNRVVARVEDPAGYADLVEHVMELGEGQTSLLERLDALDGRIDSLCNRCTDAEHDSNVAALNAEALNRLTMRLQQRQDVLSRRHDETCTVVSAYTREMRDVALQAEGADGKAKFAIQRVLDAEHDAKVSKAFAIATTGALVITLLVIFVLVALRWA